MEQCNNNFFTNSLTFVAMDLNTTNIDNECETKRRESLCYNRPSMSCSVSYTLFLLIFIDIFLSNRNVQRFDFNLC